MKNWHENTEYTDIMTVALRGLSEKNKSPERFRDSCLTLTKILNNLTIHSGQPSTEEGLAWSEYTANTKQM